MVLCVLTFGPDPDGLAEHPLAQTIRAEHHELVLPARAEMGYGRLCGAARGHAHSTPLCYVYGPVPHLVLERRMGHI